ncbi:MAG TPA: hypothetical protein VHF22_12030 [Planctomycetota bacterium]|nr:hypothetical protein [Planctomycetota bacterium]
MKLAAVTALVLGLALPGAAHAQEHEHEAPAAPTGTTTPVSYEKGEAAPAAHAEHGEHGEASKAEGHAEGAEQHAEHAEHEGPEKAIIGVYISDVREIDLKKGTFEATLYFWERHPKKAEEAEWKELEEVDFTNGKVEHLEEQDRKDDGDTTYVAWKAEGSFHFFPQLQKYPFDTQKIEIHFEHPSLETKDLVFVDDAESYKRSNQPQNMWGLGKHVTIPEYDIAGVERTVRSSVYETDFGDPQKKEAKSTYSRYVVTVTLQRKFQPFLFKILLPLMVILSMAYLVFWLPPMEIHPATELAITALLSCFAFNVAVSSTLPQIGYLVISDKFFIWTYFLLFSNLMLSVILFNMDHHGHHHQAEKGSKICRVAFPCLYALGFAYLVMGALAN